MSNGQQTVVGEMATTAQVAEAKAAIKKVRDAIARFHTIRRHNNERAAGLRASMVHPMEVQQMLKGTRNSQVEAQAVEALRQLIMLLNGREPTQQEMQQGIPEGVEEKLGLGFGVPLAVAAVAVSLCGGVYSYFNYLTTIEEGNQQRTATPLERVLQSLSDNIWGVAAVGAIVLGGAIYIQSSRSTSERRKAEIERYRAAGKALEKSLKEVEKNPDNLVEKVTDLVKNVLFPPEKNPDLSPAEKLAMQFNDLSEDEQDRFCRIVEDEDADEGDDEKDHQKHHHHEHHEKHHSHSHHKEEEDSEEKNEEVDENSDEKDE